MTTLLTNETIAEVTREIWGALLSDHGAPLLRSDLPAGDLVAVVEISGAWRGTVCLTFSDVAARHATSAIFDMPEDEIGSEEITDAIGELANVVGGNLKSLVPGPSVLSLPHVSAAPLTPTRGHLELAQEVWFSWMAEPVGVSVWTEAGDQG